MSHISGKTNCVASHPLALGVILAPANATNDSSNMDALSWGLLPFHFLSDIKLRRKKSENAHNLVCVCVSHTEMQGVLLGQVVSLKGRRRQNTGQRHGWLSHITVLSINPGLDSPRMEVQPGSSVATKISPPDPPTPPPERSANHPPKHAPWPPCATPAGASHTPRRAFLLFFPPRDWSFYFFFFSSLWPF